MQQLVDQFGWHMTGYTEEKQGCTWELRSDRLGNMLESPTGSGSDGSGRLMKRLRGNKT